MLAPTSGPSLPRAAEDSAFHRLYSGNCEGRACLQLGSSHWWKKVRKQLHRVLENTHVQLHLQIITCLQRKMSPVGACVAKLVDHTTLAQVMISRFTGSNPVSGSALTVQSLEPASDSVSISVCPSPALTVSLSVSLKNKIKT